MKTTITFEKEGQIAEKKFTVLVELVKGVNPKGVKYQYVHQVNTANVVIDDHRNDFEDWLISEDDMIRIILSQGFKMVNQITL